MADGRHTKKCCKYYNSPTNEPIWTKLGWSHCIMSLTCLPWCGCHGNSHCLATVHWTLSSYGRLDAECMNQFWWNLVDNSRVETWWQSRDQIWKLLKLKKTDGRHLENHSCLIITQHNCPISVECVTEKLSSITIKVQLHRPKFEIFKVQDGGRPPSWKSLSRHIWTKNHPSLMKFERLEAAAQADFVDSGLA